MIRPSKRTYGMWDFLKPWNAYGSKFQRKRIEGGFDKRKRYFGYGPPDDDDLTDTYPDLSSYILYT